MNWEPLRSHHTTVRVPTLSCHAESINIECEKPFSLDDVRQALTRFPGVKVIDDPEKNSYPLNDTVADQDPVCVGRIRKDFSCENGLNLWVVSDNLRKGAALNAVQIGEQIIREL